MSAWDKLSMFERADIMKLAVKSGIYNLDAIRNEYNKFAEGGGIHIDSSKKGTFTAAASRHNMGVQEFASKVLANKDSYSPAMVKKANFARNAAKWHGDGGELSLLDKVKANLSARLMNAARKNHGKGNISDKMRYDPSDPATANGGVAQSTYLLDRNLQRRMFLEAGYQEGTEGDYGLVRKAVGDRKLPVFQRKPDVISRQELVPFGNAHLDYSDGKYRYQGPKDTELIHAGNYPIAYYVDNEGKMYTKAWDLNDYGNASSSGRYSDIKQALANALDYIGNPTVVTTGFQPVVDESGNHVSAYPKGLGLIDDVQLNPEQRLYNKFIKDRGLHLETINGYGQAVPMLPEVVVTGKKNRNVSKWKHAFGGNLFDGTSQPTQQMQLGSAYWKQQARKPIFTKELAEFNKRKAEEGRQRREEFKKWAATKGKELVEKSQKDYLTTSNDNTWVENRNPTVKASKPKNPHLTERSVKGAKAHRAWEEEHPVLNTWENVLGAVPFAVASAPLAAAAGSGIAALGDAAAATSAGQAITAGLAPLTTAASTNIAGAPLYTWADAGLSSLFGAHGIQTAINEGGISPETALEIAPLGRLAKPIFNKAATALKITAENAASMTPKVTHFYHGSPVRFDDFSTDFIGSGEGGSKVMRGINLWPEEKIANAPKFANIKSPDAPLHLGVSNTPLGGELNPTVYDVSGRGLKLYTASPREVKRLSQSDLISQGYDGIQTPNQVTVFPESINKLSIDKQSSIEDFVMSHPEVERWTPWTTDTQKMQNIIDMSKMSKWTSEQWTAAQDAAIAKGDMVEAQRLRDLHSSLTDSATPGKYYRGTQTKRNSYPDRHIDEEVGEMNGIYLTKKPKYAKTYGDVEEFYLRSNNPLKTEGSWTGVIDDATRAEIENVGYDAVVNNRFDTGFLNKLLRNSRDETITFNGKNLKLADAVTYDDKGIRIPLGKRDNFKLNDIRYGVLPFGVSLTGYGLFNNQEALGGKIKKRKR